MSSFEAEPLARVEFRPAEQAGEAKFEALAAEPRNPSTRGDAGSFGSNPARDFAEIDRQASECGHAEARAELPWRDAEALREAVAALQLAAARLTDEREELRASNGRAAIELGLCVAEHVLGRELSASPSYLGRVIRRCTEALETAGPVSISLSPDACDTVMMDPEWGDSSLLEGVELRRDPSLGPGEALASSGASQVDARLESMLSEVRQALLEEIEGEVAE